MDAKLLPYMRKGIRMDEATTSSSTTTNRDTENSLSFLRCGCNQHVLDEEETPGRSLISSEPPIKNQDNNKNSHDNNNKYPSAPLSSAWCEEAALCAATANGRYQPAAYEGGGIMEATQATLDTQFGTPHTGHIYTPPTFSDHIAVSLLLHDSVLTTTTTTTNNNNSTACKQIDVTGDNTDTHVHPIHPPEQNENILTKTGTKTTKRAQPHKTQTTIASFFAPSSQNVPKNRNNNNNNSNKTNGLRTTKQQTRITKIKKPKKNSILYHFQQKNNNNKK